MYMFQTQKEYQVSIDVIDDDFNVSVVKQCQKHRASEGTRESQRHEAIETS